MLGVEAGHTETLHPAASPRNPSPPQGLLLLAPKPYPPQRHHHPMSLSASGQTQMQGPSPVMTLPRFYIPSPRFMSIPGNVDQTLNSTTEPSSNTESSDEDRTSATDLTLPLRVSMEDREQDLSEKVPSPQATDSGNSIDDDKRKSRKEEHNSAHIKQSWNMLNPRKRKRKVCKYLLSSLSNFPKLILFIN